MEDVAQEEEDDERLQDIYTQSMAKLQQAIRTLLLDLGEDATFEQMYAQLRLAKKLKREADILKAVYLLCIEEEQEA